ncbi:MAG: hypothetical protein ROO76_04745 [Terriglobia bacterium]|nr:hypothetical protein [Terriglobia bacterium]
MTRRVLLIISGILLSFTALALGQNCEKMQGSSADSVSYLTKAKPGQEDGNCVAAAINKLGEQHDESAIPVLVKFLGFQYPAGPLGKRNLEARKHGFGPTFPAELALEKFGNRALPAVLELIKSTSASREARESAVAVWMNFYKDNAPTGVALLKQEADKTKDPFARQNLGYAAFLAQLNWCSPEQKAQCKAAALAHYSSPLQ